MEKAMWISLGTFRRYRGRSSFYPENQGFFIRRGAVHRKSEDVGEAEFDGKVGVCYPSGECTRFA